MVSLRDNNGANLPNPVIPGICPKGWHLSREWEALSDLTSELQSRQPTG